jgi:ABC-type phosphate transport system substrate-binding protein
MRTLGARPADGHHPVQVKPGLGRLQHCGGMRVLTVIVAAAIAAIVGCGSSTTTSPGGGTSTTTPIASSSAVAKAKEQATACISKTSVSDLLSSSGRTELVNCLKAIVPPAEQEAFKNCITTAATGDQVWTSDGRTKFINESVPNCVNQVNVATPTSSP